MDKEKKIMIIGGHGKVGQYITKALRSFNLILVGRDRDKMQSFLMKEKIQAQLCVMDIHAIDFARLEGVGWVIVCVDQKNTKLVEHCDAHGVDYMDVTANSEFIEKIQQLKLLGNSRILLGVGLAPGLTNLLAEQFVLKYPLADTIKIELILGLGEKHGAAAIRWTLDNFKKSYRHKALGTIKPFTHKSAIDTGRGRLRTYNFNFVDQYMLSVKYKDKSFTTYLGFDQSLVTKMIYLAARLGILSLLKYKPVYAAAEKFLRNPKVGTDVFMVTVQWKDKSMSAIGQNEGRFTGLIAAEAAKRMATKALKNGLLDISDVLRVEDIIGNKALGVTSWDI